MLFQKLSVPPVPYVQKLRKPTALKRVFLALFLTELRFWLLSDEPVPQWFDESAIIG